MTEPSAKRTVPRRGNAATRAGPALHRDVYPIGRVSTEFFLRSFELVGELHRDIVGCLIIATLWHDGLAEKGKSRPIGVRELARRLDYPFETVRRHVRDLVLAGKCLIADDSVTLTTATRRSAQMTKVLRMIYVHAVRMLGDLRRIEVVAYRPRQSRLRFSRQLDRQQMVIAVAALGTVLSAMKVLRRFFDRDLVTGLVFTAIRAANVKHIANTTPAANRDLLPDSDRRPVSLMAISASMRLPYETVRRHAGKLIRQGKCIRSGRQGVIAPESAFRQMMIEANTVRELVLAFLQRLRDAGLSV